MPVRGAAKASAVLAPRPLGETPVIRIVFPLTWSGNAAVTVDPSVHFPKSVLANIFAGAESAQAKDIAVICLSKHLETDVKAILTVTGLILTLNVLPSRRIAVDLYAIDHGPTFDCASACGSH